MIVFAVLAAIAVVSGVLVITRANPVHSALFLIVNFVALAVLYLSLKAQFVAIMQVIVYAGAIMVLVLFVIMLLNLHDEERLRVKHGWRQVLGALLSAAFLFMLVQAVSIYSGPFPLAISPEAEHIGSVEGIGEVLYRAFLFPFEMASILLLAAMVGAVVLAKKRFT